MSGFILYVIRKRDELFAEAARVERELSRPGIDGDSAAVLVARLDQIDAELNDKYLIIAPPNRKGDT